ncbi:MAG: nicotinate (nicotinamide) nucleotide adenylyltransferase [Spirochaetia bacterium]|nr:nicotinate (nicotinamide) nucleotide adenylyltransferase [Spirochaetia bacterium]
MKTAVLGGSFNPVHIGHLILAEDVLSQCGYDRILFIPANIPPHKIIEDPGPDIRLAMLRAAIECFPAFAVSDCELSREGVSYTIDTIRYLKTDLAMKGQMDAKPGLVIGDDLLAGFFNWKEPQALAEEAEIIVAHRLYPFRLSLPYPHRYVENTLIPISSSEVRARIMSGRAWRSLLPPAVQAIIEQKGLYGFSAS